MITEKDKKRIDGHFIRKKPVRNLCKEVIPRFKNAIYSNIKELSIEAFIKELDNYERKHSKREYTKKKPRYGYIIKFLIPHCPEAKQIKLARLIAKDLIGEEKGLKTICITEKRVSSNYLVFYISDREYFKKEFIRRYKHDLYKSSASKKWCHADDADAVLVHSKGEIMKNKDGSIKKEVILFKERKSRRFNYKNNELAYFDKFLVDALASALSHEGLSYIGFSFPRKDLKDAKNKYLKRVIVRSNITMIMIEGMISQVISRNIDYLDLRTSAKDFLDPDEWWWEKRVDRELYNEIRSFYFKYKQRFKKGSYHYDGKLYEIDKTRCDIAEENLNRLYDIARRELLEIENKYEKEEAINGR